MLALAPRAGSYGLHKSPEGSNSETGLLLIHRPFHLMQLVLCFPFRGPIGIGGRIYGCG